jgi:hypothetical protein
MKRIALVVFLLLGLHGPALGASGVDTISDPAAVDTVSSPASVDGVTMAVANYCSSCTPGDPTDIWCEDSEGSVTEGANWTTAQFDYDNITTSGSNTISDISHGGDIASDQSCSGEEGSYSVEFYLVDDAGEDCFVREANGIVSESHISFQIYYRLISENWEASEYASVACFYDETASAQNVCIMQVGDGTGGVDLYLAYCDSDDTCDSTYNSLSSGKAIDVTVGTWYRLLLNWDQNDSTDGATLDVDGVEQATSESIGNGTTVNQTVDRLYLGSEGSVTATGSSDEIKWEVDMIGIDDDAEMGAACS